MTFLCRELMDMDEKRENARTSQWTFPKTTHNWRFVVKKEERTKDFSVVVFFSGEDKKGGFKKIFPCEKVLLTHRWQKNRVMGSQSLILARIEDSSKDHFKIKAVQKGILRQEIVNHPSLK